MSSAQFARYSGSRVLPFAPPGPGPGVCKSCGCGSANCQCGCRQCRTEAKELTFTGEAVARGGDNLAGSLAAAQPKAADGTDATTTSAKAFIGGGCCVHISLEYAAVTATAQSTVAILVRDTEGTTLIWEKVDPAGTSYQVKENVVTTKPGATLTLLAINATVRARWCEVFSC